MAQFDKLYPGHDCSLCTLAPKMVAIYKNPNIELFTLYEVFDFENMLDTMQKPMGVEANFGVIDAQGGAAYYETDNFNYTKIDANDSKIAPFGYIIRTNYSFTGTPDNGYGYIRYMAANELIYNAVASNNLTPLFIQQNMTRSLQHAHTKTNLKETDLK